MKLKLFSLFLTFVFSSSFLVSRVFADCIKPGDYNESITVDGLKRTYVLHVPKNFDGKKPLPLLFSLHGGYGNASSAISLSNFSALADLKGFIVVYPEAEASSRHWNDGRGLSKANDVKFISILISSLSKRLNIDQNMIYACGISNGGIMSYRLAMELSDKLASVASVAGSQATALVYPYPDYPVSFMEIHGTKDLLVPWKGGKAGVGGMVLSVEEAIRRWTIFDNTSSIPVIIKLPDKDPKDETTVEKYSYKSNQNSSEVVLMKVIDGGHNWPGNKSKGSTGKTYMDINSTEEIWNFFVAHPKIRTSDRKVIKVGNLNREYYIHTPTSYNGKLAFPLVFMLHGGGGNARGAMIETNWMAKADKAGFIAVFPEGTRPFPSKPSSFIDNPQTWNDGSGRFISAMKNVDDVGFIDKLIQSLPDYYNIDRKKVFVTGFSNGASMTLRIGAQLSDKITAIAPVSGHLWIEIPSPIKPIPLCYIIGTDDPLNPINGVNVKTPSGKIEYHPPVQKTIDSWVKILGCKQNPKTTSDKNGVKFVTYGGCNGNSEIKYWTVEGLGHIWPSAIVSLLPESMVGKPSNKLIANDVIWDFFSKY